MFLINDCNLSDPWLTFLWSHEEIRLETSRSSISKEARNTHMVLETIIAFVSFLWFVASFFIFFLLALISIN